MIVFACALLACTQDPGQALRHYEAGDFTAAAEAFRAATTARPDAADLWYDLALAEWRAGKLPAAEDAAERYASTPGGGRVDLHRGLLGNIRYSEAAALGQQAEAPPQPPPPAAGAAAPPAPPADPVALLEQAVGKAKAARDEFVRATAAPTAGGEVARNTERALKLLADLEKKLEEARKRRDEQQKQDQKNDQKDKNDKNDKDQQDKKDQKDQKDEQQKDQQPKDGEARPEPKQPDPKEQKDQQQKDQQQQQDPQAKDGEARPEPKPEDGKDGKEPKPAPQPRGDAPGEQLQATELTPEQKARLLEELQKLDGELRKIRAAARVGKKPVERDW